MDDLASGMENIEAEAAKTLESARNRASEILVKARDEINRILTEEPVMDDIKAECGNLVRKAKQEASKMREDSRIQVAQIRQKADKRAEKIAKRMVSIITGASNR
jgi:cell division septum initiation protein DivIVA